MKPKKVISTFIEALNSRIPPPVHTAGIQDSRPVPAVLIEEMSIDEKNYHNSHYAGSEYDGSGNVQREVYRHYYDMQLELTIRDDDEVDAYDILGDVQVALGELEQDPGGKVHDDISDIRSEGSGGISYQFYEPLESEINQTVVLKTFYDSIEENPDVLTNIGTTYDIS